MANTKINAMGGYGLDSITGNETGDWFAFTVIGSAAATVTTASPSGDALSSATIPVGVTVYGNFTTINVSSGTVLAYRKG